MPCAPQRWAQTPGTLQAEVAADFALVEVTLHGGRQGVALVVDRGVAGQAKAVVTLRARIPAREAHRMRDGAPIADRQLAPSLPPPGGDLAGHASVRADACPQHGRSQRPELVTSVEYG
eukprot:6986072-Pyramimonas_sp.AAC.1